MSQYTRFTPNFTGGGGGGGGVTSVNGITGAVTMAAGPGIEVDTAGSTVTIESIYPVSGLYIISTDLAGQTITLQPPQGSPITYNVSVLAPITLNGTAVALGGLNPGDAVSLQLDPTNPAITTGINATRSSSGAAVWGAITGTLSDQTDLQDALDLKAPLASPTFTGTVTVNGDADFTNATLPVQISTGEPNIIGLIIKGTSSGTPPAGSAFYAALSSSINADFGGGNLIATPYGGASIIGGVLDLSSGAQQSVDYDGVGNADGAIQTGAVNITVIPNYTGGTPGGNFEVFFGLMESVNSNLSLLNLYHQGTSLACDFFDSSGNPNTFIFGTWSPVSGQSYNMELDYDLTTGASRLFVDGVQLGSTNTLTITRAAGPSNTIRLGSNFLNTAPPDFSLSMPAIFNTVQHTSNFTPVPFNPIGPQTADLQQWQNSMGAPLASIDATGVASTAGYSVGATLGIDHMEVINGFTFTWIKGILTSVV